MNEEPASESRQTAAVLSTHLLQEKLRGADSFSGKDSWATL